MPKYKDSPEVRSAKKERKEKLREFLSLLDVEDMSDLKSLFKEMVGEVLENGLEAELDDELGYSKYDYRNKDTQNSRNGYSRKKMKTGAGEVEIVVPRDRNGEFEPQLVKKNETSLSGDIEEKIISREQSDRLRGRLSELRSRRKKLIENNDEEATIENIRQLKDMLQDLPQAMLDFDADVFASIVSKIRTEDDGSLSFILKGGLKLTEKMTGDT